MNHFNGMQMGKGLLETEKTEPRADAGVYESVISVAGLREDSE